jgi:hypothetical protein
MKKQPENAEECWDLDGCDEDVDGRHFSIPAFCGLKVRSVVAEEGAVELASRARSVLTFL